MYSYLYFSKYGIFNRGLWTHCLEILLRDLEEANSQRRWPEVFVGFQYTRRPGALKRLDLVNQYLSRIPGCSLEPQDEEDGLVMRISEELRTMYFVLHGALRYVRDGYKWQALLLDVATKMVAKDGYKEDPSFRCNGIESWLSAADPRYLWSFAEAPVKYIPKGAHINLVSGFIDRFQPKEVNEDEIYLAFTDVPFLGYASTLYCFKYKSNNMLITPEYSYDYWCFYLPIYDTVRKLAKFTYKEG